MPSIPEEGSEITVDQVEPVGGKPGGCAIHTNGPFPIPSTSAQQYSQHLVLAVFNNTMKVPQPSLSEYNREMAKSQLATHRVIRDIQVPIIPLYPTVPVST